MRTRTLVLVAVAVFAVLVGGFVYVALSGGDDTRRAGALSTPHSFSGGKTMLISGGTSLGFLQSSSCGTVSAPVITDAKAGKALGPTKYQPCEFEVGLGMSKELLDWIAQTLAGTAARKDLSLSTVDLNSKEVARLELQNALLSQIELPAADAGSQEAVTLKLTVDPQSIQSAKPSGATAKVPLGTKQKSFLASNFRFDLGGSQLSKVSKVDAWSFQAGPQLGDLTVTVSEADARMPELETMLQDSLGTKPKPAETTAALVFLDPTRTTELLNVSFSGVGMSGGQLTPNITSDNAVARRTFTFYVENANITFPYN